MNQVEFFLDELSINLKHDLHISSGSMKKNGLKAERDFNPSAK
jgi:hypothetical protein